MGQAINRNRRLLSSQNISSMNTIWGGHLKISNTNPNVTPMVWNAIGPDGNTNVDNVQNIHNISPESIFPPLPITTDWMTHMTYLPMDKVDPTKLDDYYINNAIKGNKTFYNLTKGRLFKLCMHPRSSRMYWQRMYTPGYDMMFSPVIGTPSDYDNGDCLLFTNAFRISDQSYNIVKYNTLTMQITVLHTWFIETLRSEDQFRIIVPTESITSGVTRRCGDFRYYEPICTDQSGGAITQWDYFYNYIRNKNNSIRLFTWCEYLKSGTYVILKYGDGSAYDIVSSSPDVKDTENRLLKYDLYTNTLTNITKDPIPNLSNHGRPKFINLMRSSALGDQLLVNFEEAGDTLGYWSSERIPTTDLCYSYIYYNKQGVFRKSGACLSLVNPKMIFGKDLYGAIHIKDKTGRLKAIHHNLNILTKYGNPYIEIEYSSSAAIMREYAIRYRSFMVEVSAGNVSANSLHYNESIRRPNENTSTLKGAIIPGLIFDRGGNNGQRDLYVMNGALYPLYNTSYRRENPNYILSVDGNASWALNYSSISWSANQLFLSNEVKCGSYNNIETNTNPAIALHKAYSFQYPHPSAFYNDNGTSILGSATAVVTYTAMILNSGNCLYTFPYFSYNNSYNYSMEDISYAFKDPRTNRKRNCLYIGQTVYEQTSIDYLSNQDATISKNKYIGVYDWKQNYNLYGETKYRDYLSEFRVPLYSLNISAHITAYTTGSIQPN